MKLRFYILSLVLGLLLCACASKASFTGSKAVFVVLNSPQIKFAEAGFLYQKEANTKIEIYKLAQPFFVLDIQKNKICVNKYCTSKAKFNEQFFQNAHYDEIVSDIINAKALYRGLNFKAQECGFEQNLTSKSDKFAIIYKVCNDEIAFEDSKNKINFSLKRIESE